MSDFYKGRGSKYKDAAKYFFEDGYPWKCKSCNSKSAFTYNPNAKIKKNYDFSYTYDGYCIVSFKFVEFCLENIKQKLCFLPLIQNPSLFYFYTYDNLPKLKEISEGLNHDDYELCNLCGFQPSWSPVGINIEYDLEEIFYIGDIMFSDPGKEDYSLYINDSLMIKLKKEKFSGIYFNEVDNIIDRRK